MGTHAAIHETTDNDLIRRIAEGNHEAFEAFHERYARQVRRALQTTFYLGEDWADIEQEVFLQIWRRAGTFDPSRGNVKSWVLVIARTRALDHLRSRPPLEYVEETPEETLLSTVLTERTGRHAEAMSIRRALEELPEHHQVVLKLAYFDGFSHSQIAEQQRRPLGTVKTHIRTSLKLLREHLEDRRN